MSTSIEAPPAKAPFPVPDFLRHTASPADLFTLCSDATDLPCRIPVQAGLFFDGTNNHMERDRKGKRVPVPLTKDEKQAARRKAKAAGLPDEEPKPEPLPDCTMTPELCSHSNVARLFEAFPETKTAQGYYRYYIQGVGTPFEEIGEPTESQEGKAFAKGGMPRIVWGIFQVMNAIHTTVYAGQPLYSTKKIGQLAQAYCNEVGQTEQGSEQQKVVTHEDWFAPHLAMLKAALAAKPKPAIQSLSVSVFGFSRGAAESVAFCHLFDRLLKGRKLAGIPADIRFLGLFDVVASVGGSASVALTLPLPGALFDGHWSWANDVDEPLPGCVANGLHLVAAHELRMNFPVTRIEGAMREVYIPGVHSNVGGGYGPGEQGRSQGGQGKLLSQIPLAFMYKAALDAGVPLLPFSELETRDQVDFKIDPELAQAWEAYTAALDGQGNLLKKHMELYYRWRAMRLNTLENTASFMAASTQSQQDMREANTMLAGDLEAIRYRRNNPHPAFGDDREGAAFSGNDAKRINQWHFVRANNHAALDDWENFALTIFDKPEPLPSAVAAFFDDYVHDSFAGFYMAGEVTEYDKRAKVKEVMKKKPEDRSKFERKVAEVTLKTEAAKRKQETGEPLSAEEEGLVKSAEGGTPYPTMTDDDAADMRSPAILTQTSTRREGGGYVIRRGYYPHEGFFLRKSRHEKDLQRAPSNGLTPGQKKVSAAKAEEADEHAPREFVWSDNLRKDVPQELMKTATDKEVATA
ncbi:T6SS phospholipase effector Tle1-like catalytic domain-containing protein [Dechloromonas denitrificans]|uniref:phospholipase effector Tle1 domain-containing protein n=1 Tax=Dechloromonas denitrificans TaxID=281362 RepID=UPI0009F99CE1|nr:DUF2235 domain-containing protein [Dechloromonas denitrificans]